MKNTTDMMKFCWQSPSISQCVRLFSDFVGPEVPKAQDSPYIESLNTLSC